MFGKQRAAYRVSRNLGDEIAFDLLDKAMEEAGLTDWRPDGIVLSKGANDPSDQLSDEFFEARDGQLYNMRIQGPAHTTTWTGDPAMEVLRATRSSSPSWPTCGSTPKLTGDLADVKTWLDTPSGANWNKYAEARDKYFKNELLTQDRLAAFQAEAKKILQAATPAKRFRPHQLPCHHHHLFADDQLQSSQVDKLGRPGRSVQAETSRRPLPRKRDRDAHPGRFAHGPTTRRAGWRVHYRSVADWHRPRLGRIARGHAWRLVHGRAHGAKHDGAQYIREHRLVVRRSLVEDVHERRGHGEAALHQERRPAKEPRQPSAGR